jgi:hypothetical protein
MKPVMAQVQSLDDLLKDIVDKQTIMNNFNRDKWRIYGVVPSLQTQIRNVNFMIGEITRDTRRTYREVILLQSMIESTFVMMAVWEKIEIINNLLISHKIMR